VDSLWPLGQAYLPVQEETQSPRPIVVGIV
jgi:hypothetical protein